LTVLSHVGLLGKGRQSRQGSLCRCRHVERVGQVQLEPVVRLHLIPQLTEQRIHAQVSHGIGCHHDFECVEILQHVVVDPSSDAAIPVLVRERRGCQLRRDSRECHGSCCRVEDRYTRAGQAVGLAKRIANDSVDAADDILNHGFGRVVDAMLFLLGRIILAKERFVEIGYGVSAVPVCFAKDDRGVRRSQDARNVVDNDAQPFGSVPR